MVKISVVIITYNEEKNIRRCLESVLPIADEIVVVDSFSKDGTKQICLEKGVRLLEHPFEGHIQQKNYALENAHYDHVLSLDADEYLSEELTESILKVKNNWDGSAFSMNRLSNYGGKWIKHGSWYPDTKIRLFEKQLGYWGGENPHDKIILKSGTKIRKLKGDLLHLGYRDAMETLHKIQEYSSIFAKEQAGKKSSSILKIMGHTLFAFLKSYVLKNGFLDGFEGLMVAFAESNHVFYKYSKLYEANIRKSIGRTIVISRTDNLGDVVLTLPLAGYLKSIYPDIKIYFIGKKYTKAVIDHCTYIDQFLDREEILRQPSILKSVNADSIFLVFPDRALAKLALQFRITNRVSTSHRWYNWIYCNRLVNFSRIQSNFHESQLNFKLLKPFRLQSNISLTDLSQYYGLFANENTSTTFISTRRFNLILHPKSKGSAREWPLMNYLQLIKSLPESDFQIFITGLKEEGELIKKQLPELFMESNVIDLTGKLSLEELISFINRADGLVASSTGVLHLASALGKYTLGLFPPIRPIHPGRWKPIGKNANYLVYDKICSDCKISLDCTCIKNITAEQVAAGINKYIANRKSENSSKRIAV